eukprot:CAMPEP_0183343084 /NCGR_PEP_ID=MMETSP0164_2-20130417/9064_1 /TAXON_ID=221442 /ORGANISM="Coccolithus pelagicus ssp braarudi, Strain PLY182g" /LENGTH=89 /DNA_ID=CAMNT_0025513833 /DNA_START=134 /DNA_END=403 /DNA_ORIENTATION=-
MPYGARRQKRLSDGSGTSKTAGSLLSLCEACCAVLSVPSCTADHQGMALVMSTLQAAWVMESCREELYPKVPQGLSFASNAYAPWFELA